MKPQSPVRHLQESNLERGLQEEIEETRLHWPLCFGMEVGVLV